MDTNAQDGWGGMPSGWGQRGNWNKPASLQEHDNHYHGGSYQGGACKFRQQLFGFDNPDILPSFSSPSSFAAARHGIFDDPFLNKTPAELDQEAVAAVCKRQGVEFPAKGKVKSGRWTDLDAPMLEYTVVDTDTGLFASGRGERDYMVLARPEEAMSFSSPADAAAVAKATGPAAKVLDSKGLAAFLAAPRRQKEVKFPNTLKEDDLKDFRITLNGSTEPYVGKIGDTLFIAKKGTHTSADHVRNEDIANKFHLTAGLRAPRSRVYEYSVSKDPRTPAQRYMDEVNGQKGAFKETVMLAEYIPSAVSLDAAWRKALKTNDTAMQKKIRAEVLHAYPVESFLAGIDVFQNDNALVDSKGNLYLVDNGASFDYRARGGRKGWFENRTDPKDKQTGHMSLLENKSQTLLQSILKGVTESDILAETRKYDFEALAKSLPKEYQTASLLEYAKSLNRLSGRK